MGAAELSGTHAGRVAVITGGGQGFGRAIAVELARRGAAIAILDLNDAPETVSAVEAVGGRALSVTADVSAPDQVDAAARRGAQHLRQRRYRRQQCRHLPVPRLSSMWTSNTGNAFRRSTSIRSS